MAIKKTAAGTWCVDFWYKDGGRFKRREKTFEKHKDAVSFYEETRGKVRNNDYVPPSKHLIKDISAKWLERVKAEVKVQTYQQYERHVNNYILPSFGDRQMTGLTFEEVENAGLHWSHEKQLAPQTVNKIFTTLGAIYKWSKKFGVRHNPMDDVDRQKQNKSLEAIESEALTGLVEINDDDGPGGHIRPIGPHEVYSADEVGKLIQNSLPGLERALLLTAVMTGMRHGELNGFQKDRVDFEKRRLLVSRSLTQVKGGAIIERPKSKSSYRFLPMTPLLVSELKRWLLQCPPNEHNLLFVNANGKPLNRHVNNLRLKAAAERAGIKKLSMHNLRHSFASQLIAVGRPVTEVSKLLGHADAGITMRVYAHWTGQDHAETAGALEAQYFPVGAVS